MQYKILIYGNGIYKEIRLGDVKKLTIGTDKRNQIWIKGNDFQRPFSINVEIKDSTFYICDCSRVRVLNKDTADEGIIQFDISEDIEFAYLNEETSLFHMKIVSDFEEVNADYHNKLEIGDLTEIKIGTTPDADIRIIEDNWERIFLKLNKTIDGYSVSIDSGKEYIGLNGVSVIDERFSIHNNDFINIGNIQFWYSQGCIYTENSNRISCKLNSSVIAEQNNQLKYPEFIRNVRLQFKQPKEKITVLQPSTKPQEPQGNLWTRILPTIIMMIIMTVMRVMIRSNVIYAIYFVVMMGTSTIMSVASFISDKKRYKKRISEREIIYNEYIEKKECEIQIKRNDEKLIAGKMNALPQETLEQIHNFDSRLFEKIKSHEDFLDVAIGIGIVDSVNQIDFKEQEYVETEDFLNDIPAKLHDKYAKISDMPIILHLKDVNAIGFIGTRNKLYQITKNLLICLAAQHFYQDVKFYIMMEEDDVPYFEWVRWLQNVNMGMQRNILYDEGSKKAVLESVYTELSSRENMKEDEIKALPHFIVFAYKSSYMRGHPITKYVKNAKKLGFTFLFFEEYKEFVHEECDELVCLDRDTYNGFIQNTEDAVITQEFEYPHLNMSSVAAAALKLACVHVKEISLESTLTKKITLYDLLNIMSAYDLNIGNRWKYSDVHESMAAPLGIDSSGQIVYLDLHEKAHGPHGLVAGTTGSGKSELLQSYVLSMSTQFHPYEVAFVIIDFKGGGMANQFKNLPHLNGAITNIDGKQIERSLMSIKAELLKRQKLFAEYSVNKIDDYIELFKQRKASIPLPHLILIVDEFAELKSEQPEFMKELISAARIGRSLGMHLILATQKPAGVVNDQIWSNSRFKLCLKVQDKNDSNEVLKSPLAAEIREPGRCYLQVGNNEIFQLFQSAYSGASVSVEQIENQKKYEINIVDFAGRRQVIYKQEPAKQKASKETQLDAIVTYIDEYCKDNNIKRLPDICLPPLEEIIEYPQIVNMETNNTDIIVPIGIYDDPSSQIQDVIDINLTKDNCYITGSSLSGKTNLLQTIIRALCDKYSAEEVCIYIVDFASMMLRNFEGLNQVGGVVTLTEDTKLKQLFDMISATIEERKIILSSKGLSSFSAYREAGFTDIKQIILMVENFGMLRATYPEYENVLGNICRDGASVGVSVVMTNPQATGLNTRMITYFGEKISMYQNDRTQYAIMFEHCKLYPDNTPGRGIIKRNNEVKEFQTYLAFSAEKEIEKVAKIREFVTKINEKNKGIIAKKIPTIPDIVTEDYILTQYDKTTDVFNEYTIPIGIRYEDIQPMFVSLLRENFIGMLGRDELGRRKFLINMLNHVYRYSDIMPVELYIIDDVNRELQELGDWDCTKEYTTNSSEVERIISVVFNEAKTRYNNMIIDSHSLDDKPQIFLIFNSSLTEDMLNVGKASNQMHELLVSKLKGCKVCIMHSNINNVSVSFKSTALTKMITESCNILAFEDIRNIKIIAPTSSMIRNNTKKMENGDAFYINNGVFTKIRTTLN